MEIVALVVAGGPYDDTPIDGVAAIRRAVDTVSVFAPPKVVGANACLDQRAGGAKVAVLLHDAARPLAPRRLARAVLAAVESGADAAVPVLPLTDTVKRVDGAGRISQGPERDGLLAVQTPQAFRLPALLDALTRADLHDAALHVAGRVVTVPGDPAAFAVRSPWDLQQAELLSGRIDA